MERVTIAAPSAPAYISIRCFMIQCGLAPWLSQLRTCARQRSGRTRIPRQPPAQSAALGHRLGERTEDPVPAGVLAAAFVVIGNAGVDELDERPAVARIERRRHDAL